MISAPSSHSSWKMEVSAYIRPHNSIGFFLGVWVEVQIYKGTDTLQRDGVCYYIGVTLETIDSHKTCVHFLITPSSDVQR